MIHDRTLQPNKNMEKFPVQSYYKCSTGGSTGTKTLRSLLLLLSLWFLESAAAKQKLSGAKLTSEPVWINIQREQRQRWSATRRQLKQITVSYSYWLEKHANSDFWSDFRHFVQAVGLVLFLILFPEVVPSCWLFHYDHYDYYKNVSLLFLCFY